MILKKSNILLIVIAIFLLISIGSVCAKENITDDSDVQLADDGTDVVLSNSDTEENVADDTQTEKINTTIETDKDKYEFKQDSNKTISVTVKDNKTDNINVNKSDLSVLNGNKSISFDYTNSFITIKEALPVGNYNLTINYLGSETYINSTKVIALKVYGNSTIETVTSVVCNGKDIEIPVKVYDQVEYIKLIKDNFNLTLVYTNETGNISNLTITEFDIVNDTIKFNTTVAWITAKLKIEYANATEAKTVDIKVSSEVKAQKDEYKFKSEENKTISITILGAQENQLNVTKNDLKVFDNGKEITDFKYNNTNLTLNLGVGVHNITIQYKGNERYNASNSTPIEIKVSGNNTINVPVYVVSDGKTVIIPVTLFDGSENITLTKDFTLNLTYTANGNVTSQIISDYKTAAGNLTFNVESLKWIKASVNINYVNSTGFKNVIIYLNSTVEAVPATDKYRNNETNNISVTVKDNNRNALNITKNDLRVLDNGKEIAFTYNNSIINVKLEEGVHNLTIMYKGNDTYISSNTTIERRVYGDMRFNPNETAILDENKNVTITINLNDGADLMDINKTKLTITVFWTVNNQTRNRTVSDYRLNGQNITFAVNEEFESCYVDIKYDNLTAKTDIKVNTEITASDAQYSDKDVKNITATIVTGNGYKINITKDNIQVLNNGKALNIDVNNSVITIKDDLKYGVYNLTVKYLGTYTFLASEKNVTLTVYGINATSPVEVNSTNITEVKIKVVNGNETVDITSDDLIVNVTYKNGNDTLEIKVLKKEIKNGTLILTLENGNFTTATLNIKYNSTEANVTLNRIYNVKIIPINVANDYQDGNFTFQLVDADTGDILSNRTVSVSMKQAGTNGTQIYFITKSSSGGYNLGTSTTLTSDENGIISLKNENFYPGLVLSDVIYAPVGDYIMTISGSGLLKGENKTNITINKIDVNVVLEAFNEYYGTDKKVTIKVTNAKTGKALAGVYVLLNITGATLSSPRQLTDVNGTIQLGVTGLPANTYQMAFESNDTNLNTSKGSGSFTIKKIPITITAKNVSIYYNSGATATIKITDKRTGKALRNAYVIIQIDNSKTAYALITDKNGKASFSASLKVGKHTYKILNVFSVEERDNNGTKTNVLVDIYQYSAVTKTITVKMATGKFSAKKLSTYYRSGKYFTAKLTNTKNKKAIFNAKVKLQIYNSKLKYKPIKTYTDMSGKINLLLDGLAPGSYKIVVSCADSKDYTAKKITKTIVIKKAPTKLIPKKLTAKKGAKKYFKVTVKNKKTKKVIKGVKVKIKVYTGKKAKTYKVKTDSKGVAKLLVNKLKVGKHKVVISSGDKYCVAKKAKSTIKIKK